MASATSAGEIRPVNNFIKGCLQISYIPMQLNVIPEQTGQNKFSSPAMAWYKKEGRPDGLNISIKRAAKDKKFGKVINKDREHDWAESKFSQNSSADLKEKAFVN